MSNHLGGGSDMRLGLIEGRKLWWLGMCVGLSLLAAEAAGSDPASGAKITRTLLQSHVIEGTNQELREYLITYAPGTAAPPHHHPVVGLGYILEGTAESRFEGERVKVYHAGDSFQDRALTKHVLFRNPDHENLLRFLIFYVTETGAPLMELDAP